LKPAALFNLLHAAKNGWLQKNTPHFPRVACPNEASNSHCADYGAAVDVARACGGRGAARIVARCGACGCAMGGEHRRDAEKYDGPTTWHANLRLALSAIAATLTKSYPPVLIGHGAGALVVEKYIESYPAKYDFAPNWIGQCVVTFMLLVFLIRGLVFVNPWTIDTVNVILREWPKRYPKAWQRVQTQGGSLRVLLDDPGNRFCFFLCSLLTVRSFF